MRGSRHDLQTLHSNLHISSYIRGFKTKLTLRGSWVELQVTRKPLMLPNPRSYEKRGGVMLIAAVDINALHSCTKAQAEVKMFWHAGP